jgi:hypothetical protein
VRACIASIILSWVGGVLLGLLIGDVLGGGLAAERITVIVIALLLVGLGLAVTYGEGLG